MSAAEKLASDLNAMANYFAMAVFADGRDGLNGTLKTVEGVPRTCSDQFKTLVVIVAATSHFAIRHLCDSRSAAGQHSRDEFSR